MGYDSWVGLFRRGFFGSMVWMLDEVVRSHNQISFFYFVSRLLATPFSPTWRFPENDFFPYTQKYKTKLVSLGWSVTKDRSETNASFSSSEIPTEPCGMLDHTGVL